jgi:hypothetical protein
MKHTGTFVCEKVIFDNRGAPSLITVMQNVHINTLPGMTAQEIPSNAVMPKEWFVFSAWLLSSEDMGQQYEQVFQIYWPSEEKFNESRSEFTGKDDWQYNTLQLLGMPVGQQGKLRIVTWVEHAGKRISDLIENSVKVKHGPAPAPAVGPELRISR